MESKPAVGPTETKKEPIPVPTESGQMSKIPGFGGDPARDPIACERCARPAKGGSNASRSDRLIAVAVVAVLVLAFLIWRQVG